jgi:DNA polymerase-1
VIRDTQQQARRKYIVGLDGRRLFVRSKHAALNTDLQGMGATIANWWLIFIEEKLTEAGLTYGWDGDYVFCAWVHDEVQIACRIGLEEIIMKICIEAAAEAGVYLGFSLPVDASASHGINWSETH